MGQLWNTGDDITAEKLNKSFNTGIAADVDDSTELPSTVGEAIFQFDRPRIHLSQDGETYGLQIPVIVDVPATATSEGLPGQMATDASGNCYLCIAENVWVKATFATW